MNVLSIAVNVVSSDDCRGKWTPDSCCFIVGNCVVTDDSSYTDSYIIVGENIVLND